MKELRCKDAGVNCDYVARGRTVEEVVKLAREHGKIVHHMTEIPQEMEVRMKSLIKEVSDR